MRQALENHRMGGHPTYTAVIYALQAAGFINGLTFIAAIIMNYVKRDEVAGTWLESHFKWQIRTFWFGLLWSIIGTILLVILIGYAVLLVNTLWVIYRIVWGWLRLTGQQPMPV